MLVLSNFRQLLGMVGSDRQVRRWEAAITGSSVTRSTSFWCLPFPSRFHRYFNDNSPNSLRLGNQQHGEGGSFASV